MHCIHVNSSYNAQNCNCKKYMCIPSVSVVVDVEYGPTFANSGSKATATLNVYLVIESKAGTVTVGLVEMDWE